jgi:pimeloyl-ACP methyl ester carboxylesterase
MQSNQIETRYIQFRNNRRISYCEYGDLKGKPVFYFHGTPGSRYEPEFGDRPGKEHGYPIIPIIAVDRLGMGQSDHVSGRKLLDWPQDVIEAAKHLEIERFGVIGLSGWGPYALACSYAIPDRLEFSVLMGSWGPVAEEPSLWNETAPLDRFLGKLSRSVPWAFYAPFSFLGYAAKKMPRQFNVRG